MLRPISLTLLVLLVQCSSSFGQNDWTRFQNGGVADLGQTELAIEWGPESGIAWSTPLVGYGQSSPVSDGELIYVTSTSGKNKEKVHVQAIRLADGKEAWKFEANNLSPEKNSLYVSRAAITPAVDETGVICLFEGGNLFALSNDGSQRWKRDLVADYGDTKARHSLASSLEQNKDHVFVWIEREKDPYLLAISKASGETVWKSAGLGVTSWSSPRLVPVGDTHHLVLSGSGKIAGFDPENGKQLWAFDEVSGNSTTTPMPVGNGQFLIGASGGRGNSNNVDPAQSNGIIKINNEESGFSAKWVWRAKKATCSFGSPIAYGKRAYFVNRVGALFCLDLETGKEIFAGRSPSKSVWATPLATSKGIYLFGKDGTTAVIGLGDTLEVKAKNKLWDAAGATGSGRQGGRASFSGPVAYAAIAIKDKLIVRRGDNLFAIGK